SLALQNIFCLHASAVEHNNKAILFLGKSGVGKSTLAEYLAINSNYKIKRIADDIVPVKIENSIAYTLPHFPQLKLSNDIQYSDDSPSKLSTSAIYILEKYNRRKSVEIKTLKSAENMLTLISNTVASRLYDKELNQKHLDFCSHVVGNVAFNEITYPHNKQTLTLVENLIIENS
nr:hypothetical protein [Candidatus Dadabacteria bacterium]NIS08288.1 hypothetical protein [Candidatus Dadabacteria bacterium]NIV41572.1 hypothetical protein [Candidatus Dadabacteria bacterium]NIY21779.1 hypothetical protein [Candidatus Dadabacteria bacterium]